MKKGAKQCGMSVVRALSPDPFFRRTKSTAAIKQANEAGRNFTRMVGNHNLLLGNRGKKPVAAALQSQSGLNGLR